MKEIFDHWWPLSSICAGATWLSLLVRFHKRGRLLGTKRSAGAALFVVVWVACAAGPLAALAIAHASALPSSLVGAGTGAGVASWPGRNKRQSRKEVMPGPGKEGPAGKFLDGMDALMLGLLTDQMAFDQHEWCESVASDFADGYELRDFLAQLELYLLRRVGIEPEQQTDDSPKPLAAKHINAAYQQALTAAKAWITKETAYEKKQREDVGAKVAEAKTDCARARGEATNLCCALLKFAYNQGRRSCSGVENLKRSVLTASSGTQIMAPPVAPS